MRLVISTFAALCLLITGTAFCREPQSIQINNNDTAAGHFDRGVLKLRLEITNGNWYPQADDGRSIHVQAFAEEGKRSQIPGPLIRVVEGQKISVAVLNKTSATAKVFGLHERPGNPDLALEISAGKSKSVEFNAGNPGLYYYWATTTNSTLDRTGIDSQLSGAFIVQAKGESLIDPIYIIGFWEQQPLSLWVINGKMWPYTKRFTQKVGESRRSMWINTSTHHHPMHLHGAYFTVLSDGNQENQITYTPEQRPFVVTHDPGPGGTMQIEWTPIHEGNWMFHCHIPFHTDWMLGLNPPDVDSFHGDHENHMAGLAIGFTATGKDEVPSTAETFRHLDLFVAQRDKRYKHVDTFPDPLIGMGYQLQENNSPLSAPSSPGPLILLKRGEPVEITIHNQLPESTAVHWHGIELESYYDGVPNWSGMPGNTTPSIKPGQTFTAKFTPPRAGSFMYHTHMDDLLQIGMGLAGPLIVLDPDKTFDPETDKILFVTRDGMDDKTAPFLLNGTANPPAMHLEAGKSYRLRFFLLTFAGGSVVHLLKDGSPANWKAIAKDGADLPPSQSMLTEAEFALHTGETFDFEWSPAAGNYRLEGRDGDELQFGIDIHVTTSVPER